MRDGIENTTTDTYARAPSLGVWCMSYAFDDDEPQCLHAEIHRNQLIFPDSPELRAIHEYERKGGLVYAHNAFFEINIQNKHLAPRQKWPELKITQMRCTMAMCYAMALPGALEKAAPALGIDIRKDIEGKRLMLQMAKPRKIYKGECETCRGGGVLNDGEPGDIYVNHWKCPDCYGTGDKITWWDDDDRRQRLGEYCDQDIRTERGIKKRVRELSPTEQKYWFFDYKINERGLYLDVELIKEAVQTSNKAKEDYDAEIQDLTDRYVSACTNTTEIKNYLNEKCGLGIDSVAKDIIRDLLARDDLSEHTRAVLELRQRAGKTSTRKLNKMLATVSADSRIRYISQYHGAGTGRNAGRIIQPLNMPRPDPVLTPSMIEAGLDYITEPEILTLLYGSPLDFISWALRQNISAPPGYELIAGDYSSVESRYLAWDSGEESKLAIFNTHGKVYEANAAITYGKDIEDIDKKSNERQVGKVQELAFGYEGGIGAGAQMGKTYNVNPDAVYPELWARSDKETREKAEWQARQYLKQNPDSKLSLQGAIAFDIMKQGWRKAAPNTVKYWRQLENAAKLALQNPGKIYTAKRVKFFVNGSFLWCKLPSSRLLCYPYAKLKVIQTPWGEDKESIVYKTVNQVTRKWATTNTYGGKLAENVTQAGCRDLLMVGLVNVELAGYPVVLHVYDEAVSEIPVGFGSVDEYEDLLCRQKPWANGLPLQAEGWRGKRYRK